MRIYYEYYIEYNYNLLHNYILYIGIPQAQHISVYKYMNISHIIYNIRCNDRQ